ncbi:hypothetical protein JW890_06770, partial [candidate division WOR-3 bacterium]|nr:hypothetical protein [candidate division WOR-3 bacterium]
NFGLRQKNNAYSRFCDDRFLEQDYYIKKKIHINIASLEKLQPGESFRVLVDRKTNTMCFLKYRDSINCSDFSESIDR